MITECERCKKEAECRFFGWSADVDRRLAQNGEWLCDPCVPLRERELDDAISKLEAALGEDDQDD